MKFSIAKKYRAENTILFAECSRENIPAVTKIFSKKLCSLGCHILPEMIFASGRREKGVKFNLTPKSTKGITRSKKCDSTPSTCALEGIEIHDSKNQPHFAKSVNFSYSRNATIKSFFFQKSVNKQRTK